MNIKITYNWLLEYLDTDASPEELQKYLSLCGPAIERIIPVEDDYILDFEVTSNRIDMASVIGIAQEAQAILPRFGKKAKLKQNPLAELKFNQIKLPKTSNKKLTLEIVNPEVASRATAIVISEVEAAPSPRWLQKRLEACDIRAINNIVDITNYLMLALGQPTHAFDYDRICEGSLKMRLSRPGEKIQTLDGKEFILPGDDIVIEDASGSLVDLCGIMGGYASAIKEDTKNIIFFVQTYNKRLIRHTSMNTGQRTIAATYFDKGLDEERVEPTVVYGISLFQQLAKGKIASQLIDIYPNPYISKHIKINQKQIKNLIGENLPTQEIKQILQDLGFITQVSGDDIDIQIPASRRYDMNIPEDIVEEVARVYGYHRLGSHLPPAVYIAQPPNFERLFKGFTTVKLLLKHLGLNEVMNYSMISEELINKLKLNIEDYLEVNSVSRDLKYLRRELWPSLLQNLINNQGKSETLKFFEVAKTYLNRKSDLPQEEFQLAIATNTNFFDLKGIVESIFNELGIKATWSKSENKHLVPCAQLFVGGEKIGLIGEFSPLFQAEFTLKGSAAFAEVNFEKLLNFANFGKTYQPISQFSTIKLDQNFKLSDKFKYEDLDYVYKISSLITKFELITLYNNVATIRFYFSNPNRNLTEEEAQAELAKITTHFTHAI